MTTPFLSEIRMFGGNFAPTGWAFCDGQLLSIAQNDALFALIGTTYGGDGQSTFALPDLRGRLAMHQGSGPGLSNVILGETGGSEAVTLTVTQIPVHTHAALVASGVGYLSEPAEAIPAAHRDYAAFDSAPAVPMAANALSPAGGNQAHGNMAPYLCVSFIIALSGIFPSPA